MHRLFPWIAFLLAVLSTGPVGVTGVKVPALPGHTKHLIDAPAAAEEEEAEADDTDTDTDTEPALLEEGEGETGEEVTEEEDADTADDQGSHQGAGADDEPPAEVEEEEAALADAESHSSQADNDNGGDEDEESLIERHAKTHGLRRRVSPKIHDPPRFRKGASHDSAAGRGRAHHHAAHTAHTTHAGHANAKTKANTKVAHGHAHKTTSASHGAHQTKAEDDVKTKSKSKTKGHYSSGHVTALRSRVQTHHKHRGGPDKGNVLDTKLPLTYLSLGLIALGTCVFGCFCGLVACLCKRSGKGGLHGLPAKQPSGGASDSLMDDPWA